MNVQIETCASWTQHVRDRLPGQDLRAGACLPPRIVPPMIEVEEKTPGLDALRMNVGRSDELPLCLIQSVGFLERIAQGKEKLQEGRVLLTTPLELFNGGPQVSPLHLAEAKIVVWVGRVGMDPGRVMH